MYFAFRDVPSYPKIFRQAVDQLAAVRSRAFPDADFLVGVASTGIPLAAALAYASDLPMGFTRKVAGLRTIDDLAEATGAWGDHSLVEGAFKSGMRILIVDDVVSGGASKEVAVALVQRELDLRGVDAEILGVAVVVDRGNPDLRELPFRLEWDESLVEQVGTLAEVGASSDEIDTIRSYLLDPEMFQNPEVQRELRERAFPSEGS
jgi:orotate phosphoribosyltransferase